MLSVRTNSFLSGVIYPHLFISASGYHLPNKIHFNKLLSFALGTMITHSFTCFRMEWEAGERSLVYGVTLTLNWMGTMVNFENHGISQLFNLFAYLFIHIGNQEEREWQLWKYPPINSGNDGKVKGLHENFSKLSFATSRGKLWWNSHTGI